jgi:hypothetical protein
MTAPGIGAAAVVAAAVAAVVAVVVDAVAAGVIVIVASTKGLRNGGSGCTASLLADNCRH